VSQVKVAERWRPLLNQGVLIREVAMARAGFLVRFVQPCAVAAVFGLLATLVGGCVTTFSAEPLGETIATLKPDDWNGVWMDMEGHRARVLVVDSAVGQLRLVKDWKDCSAKGAAGEAQDVLHVRQSGSWYFLSSPEKEVVYDVWLAFRRDGEVLYVCGVDDARVRELVMSGVLPGFVCEGDVVIWPLSPDHYRHLLSDERPVFRCGPPGGYVYVRLPTELDPCRKAD
jgi:hypothetical protein